MRNKSSIFFRGILLAGGLLTLPALACSAKVIFVRPGGLDANNGATWTLAKRTIQAAMNISAAGDEIHVGSGPAYVEHVVAKSGVALLGGYVGTGANANLRDPNLYPTIIDGSNSGIVVAYDTAGATSKLDGFTLRNGTGNGIVSCVKSATVVSNNIIATTSSHGIYVYSGTPTITGNTISGCSSNAISCHGGAAVTITGNVVLGNSLCGVYADGAVITLTNNDIHDNQRGVSVNTASTIANNRITHNQTTGDGGGIAMDHASPTVTGNIITGNRANGNGGGIYVYSGSPVIANNLIAWNTGGEGGALRCLYRCAPKVTNNTFVSNAAMSRTGGGAITLENSSSTVNYPTIANNVFANNSSGINRIDTTVVPTLTRNCLFNNGEYGYQNLPAGAKDMFVDPMLASARLGDYHLAAGSPCINTGDDASANGANDLDGDARKGGSHVDIGADEYMAGRAVAGTRHIIYVKAAGSDVADGSSWTKAKATIPAALAAAVPGDTVWVAKGTYAATPLLLPAGVAVLGGFAGTETADAQRNPANNVVIVDGQKARRCATADHVGVTTVLDGLTLKNGNAGNGSGLNCYYASPLVAGCVVAEGTGIGVYGYHSDPIVTGCVDRNNGGQGVYLDRCNALISSCTISANKGGNGAGIYLDTCTAMVYRCSVLGNTGSSFGGGVLIYQGSPVIESNIIRQNSVTSNASTGGGIYCERANAQIISNVIAGNISAKAAGIKIYNSQSALIANNTIVSNTPGSATQAGGIEVEYNSSPSIVNNIVAFNVGHGVMMTSVSGHDGSPQPAANCLFGNTGQPYQGMFSGPGDIAVNPQFRDPGNGDFHLKPTSPCINRGDDRFVIAKTFDIDAQVRVYGAHVDIGADEVNP